MIGVYDDGSDKFSGEFTAAFFLRFNFLWVSNFNPCVWRMYEFTWLTFFFSKQIQRKWIFRIFVFIFYQLKTRHSHFDAAIETNGSWLFERSKENSIRADHICAQWRSWHNVDRNMYGRKKMEISWCHKKSESGRECSHHNHCKHQL